MALEITLLGAPRVVRDGRPVAFETRKALALLAHLLVTGRPRSRDALCELLWPGRDPEHARGALRRTLSTLRTAVGAEAVETAGDAVGVVGLDCDVHRFRALLAEGRLAEAVAVMGGELLEGFALRDSPDFEAWVLAEDDALRRELGAALARLAADASDVPAAIGHARRWLALEPLHEPAHRALIRLLALNGERAAALEQYRACVRTLSQELGVAPVEETVALFEQVSEGALAPPPPPAVPAPRTVPAPRAGPPADLPLVGRDDALAALLALPAGRLAVVEGEAGIGKSRLVRELAARAAEPMLLAACHPGEAGLPYAPVVELLRQAPAHDVAPQRLADAALLLPELARPGLPPPAAPGEPAARTRLFEGVAAVLGAAPALLVVDDVHWADDASLDLLAYLARRLDGRAVRLVLTWRTEEVPAGHRLRALPAASTVLLGRLTAEDVARLAPSPLAAEVHAGSEGLPLFVAELLAAPGHRASGPVLEGRLAGLSGLGSQLLETAAVVGRSFDLDTLRAASGRTDEEAAAGLDELTARGLVREAATDPPAYDFTHHRLRELVAERTGLARRRLLHRRVADALLRAAPGPEAAARLAGHLRAAGDPAAAALQHARAAEHAAAVLGFGEALEHLDAALALGHPQPAALHERAGDLRTLTGDYAGALIAYEAAAALAGPDAVARLEHRVGGVHQRRGEWSRAEARFLLSLDAAPAPALRARVLADLSLTLHQAGEPAGAAARAAEARVAAQEAGDDLALAQAHNLLGVLARAEGRLGEARAELQRSLELAAQPSARTAALNNLALVARDAGDLDAALALTTEALERCAATGDRHREAALENNLADLHHAAGRPEAAMAHLKRAVAGFADIGADEAARLPEVWKLVSW